MLTEMHGVEQLTKNVRVRKYVPPSNQRQRYLFFLNKYIMHILYSTEVELRQLEEQKKTFTSDQFHEFMLIRDAVIAPAFLLQRSLQRKLGGATFWKQQTRRRESLFTTSYVSIAHLLNSVNSRTLSVFVI